MFLFLAELLLCELLGLVHNVVPLSDSRVVENQSGILIRDAFQDWVLVDRGELPIAVDLLRIQLHWV